MKNFKVYYVTNVENTEMAAFNTLEEAKSYCAEETRGCEPVSDNDNRADDQNISFCFEVYDGDPIVLDEDGDVVETKNPTYTTDWFYQEDK